MLSYRSHWSWIPRSWPWWSSSSLSASALVPVCVCEYVQKSFSASTYIYHSLANECPWVEHHTSLPKRGVDVLLSVSIFNHKRAHLYVSIAYKFAEVLDEQQRTMEPMALEIQVLTTQHSEQQNATMSVV